MRLFVVFSDGTFFSVSRLYTCSTKWYLIRKSHKSYKSTFSLIDYSDARSDWSRIASYLATITSHEGLTLETSTLETLHWGQFIITAQLIKPNCLEIQFLESLPSFVYMYLIRYWSLSVLLVQYFLSSSDNCEIADTDGANIVMFFLGSDI